MKEHLEVYFIAGSQNVENREIYTVLEEALKAGITMFQFREKGVNSLEKHPKKKKDLAIQLQILCQQYGVPFVVNDDVELALSIEADGIHVGQKDTPIENVLRRVSPDTIVGLSASNLQEVEKAEVIQGLDYIGLGPVFATSSKEDADPELGITGIKEIIGTGKKQPTVAIGGITAENATEIHQTGVDGVSVISAITESKNIKQTVQQLKENSFEYN